MDSDQEYMEDDILKNSASAEHLQPCKYHHPHLPKVFDCRSEFGPVSVERHWVLFGPCWFHRHSHWRQVHEDFVDEEIICQIGNNSKTIYQSKTEVKTFI